MRPYTTASQRFSATGRRTCLAATCLLVSRLVLCRVAPAEHPNPASDDRGLPPPRSIYLQIRKPPMCLLVRRRAYVQFHINGDGHKLEVRLVLTWRTLKALLKAVLAVIGAAAALLSAPEIVRLLEHLGR